jgi:crotonobetainyl-CoA:carnitine CoA-transferase CaiB-like acyl-CoA transferase
VRILAFTHVAAGPYATLQLAALGAEVIKVESRTRVDSWRYRDKNRDPEESRPFADHNKNTRSVTLNLKTASGVELARALARQSDVVIDNFSAGVMDRLGLGYRELSADHSEIIVIHLSGMGSTGPYRSCVTFGPSIMAISGLTYLWNHPGLPEPVGSQTSYPDYLVGGYAAFAVTALLNERDRTGRGRELDLNQIEVALACLGPAVVSEVNNGPVAPQGNGNGIDAPRGCYPCRGGNDDWCVISVRTDKEWNRLAEIIGAPEVAGDSRFRTAAGRIAHKDDLDRAIGAWTCGRSAREVMEACQAGHVPAGIVATGRDLATDPHLADRGFLTDMDHPRLGRQRFPGPPIRLGTTPLPTWRLGPLMGQDNRLLLGELLGLSDQAIERYERDGVIA